MGVSAYAPRLGFNSVSSGVHTEKCGCIVNNIDFLNYFYMIHVFDKVLVFHTNNIYIVTKYNIYLLDSTNQMFIYNVYMVVATIFQLNI